MFSPSTRTSNVLLQAVRGFSIPVRAQNIPAREYNVILTCSRHKIFPLGNISESCKTPWTFWEMSASYLHVRKIFSWKGLAKIFRDDYYIITRERSSHNKEKTKPSCDPYLVHCRVCFIPFQGDNATAMDWPREKKPGNPSGCRAFFLLESLMDKYEEHEDKWKTNRQKKRLFKAGLYWCSGCDCNLVGDWKKCEVCGHRNGVKRNKKWRLGTQNYGKAARLRV